MKYGFETLIEQILERKDNYAILENSGICYAHDKVVIDPAGLAEQKQDIIKRKGAPYYEQLRLLATSKDILTVSAIKRINKPSSNFVDGNSASGQEEADVVRQFNPGSFHSPMSVPLSILKKVSDYNGSFNQPLPDETEYKAKTNKEVRDDYNKGKDPKGTRHNQ